MTRTLFNPETSQNPVRLRAPQRPPWHLLPARAGGRLLTQFGAHFINHTQHLGGLEAAAAVATWTGISGSECRTRWAGSLVANVKWFLGVPSKRFAAVAAADYLLLLSEVHCSSRGEGQRWRRGRGSRTCQLQAALSAGDWLLLLFYLVRKLFGGSVANTAFVTSKLAVFKAALTQNQRGIYSAKLRENYKCQRHVVFSIFSIFLLLADLTLLAFFKNATD